MAAVRGVFTQQFLVTTWIDWAAANPGSVWSG
jgi:hypothetical protein